MSLAQHFVIIWICVLVFLVLTTLKLDSKLQVLWFVVFAPLFVLDAVQLLFLAFRITVHLRNGGRDNQEVSMKRKGWNVAMLLCTILFQVFLCIDLDEIIPGMKLHFVFIPLWLMLLGHAVDLFRFQIRIVNG